MSPFLGCRQLHVQYYDRKQPTLSGLTLTIERGECVLLLGPSGCGKSTLVHVLSGVIPRSIQAMTKGDVWRPARTGVVFQDPDTQFCMLNVEDEMAFSLENRQIPPEAMPRLIKRAKALAGLEAVPNHAAIHTLSGGMKQRLAIASVLALEPEALFLDEPTAQLDPEATEQVLNVIRQLKGNYTIVLIEHKLDGIMEFIDRVVLFSRAGHIIDEDLPEHVFKRNESRIKQYGIWTPRLWPCRWDDVLQGKHPERVQSWRRVKEPSPPKPPLCRQEEKLLVAISNGELTYDSHPVWKNVNLTVHQGEWIAVMGPNGSGKSSLLKVIMGLERLSTGDIRYGFIPKPQRRINTDVLSSHIGFVFQNPEHQFITDRVADEVAYSGKLAQWPEDQLQKKVDELLNDFGLDALREAHPFTLSVGQKRRLSVASMLLDRRELLLLDEPTFGQDARTTGELMKRLKQLNDTGTAIVMATHDVELAYRYASRMVVLAEGTIVFSGKPDELLAREDEWQTARLRLPLYLEYVKRTQRAAKRQEVTPL